MRSPEVGGGALLVSGECTAPLATVNIGFCDKIMFPDVNLQGCSGDFGDSESRLF